MQPSRLARSLKKACADNAKAFCSWMWPVKDLLHVCKAPKQMSATAPAKPLIEPELSDEQPSCLSRHPHIPRH